MSVWPKVLIGQLCEAKIGTRDPAREPDKEFLYVDISSVDNKEKIIRKPVRIIGHSAPIRARQVIRENDILVSMTRPNLNAVAIVPMSMDGEVCSTGFSVLRSKGSLSPRYLFHFVQSRGFVDSAVGAVSGALYPAITASFLRSLPLPLPPLDEQHRIVRLLDRAAEIRRRANVAHAKARAIISALFLDTFGDPASNPKGWPVRTVGDLLESAAYGTSQKANDHGVGVPMIRMGNVTTGGQLDTSDLKYVDIAGHEREKAELIAGDLLFNRTNSKELVGKTGLWDGRFEAVAASYFIRLRADRELCSPSYLWAYLNTHFMKRVLFDTARGAIGQANINAKELKAFRVPVPPLSSQTAFAEQTQRLKSLARQLDAAAVKAEAMAAGLSAEVFG